MMPPLLAVLFFFFIKQFDKNDLLSFVYILAFLVVFEVSYGYLTLSTLVYFLFLYFLVMPTLKKIFICKLCIEFLQVVFVYIGFWLYTTLVHSIFWLDLPSIDLYTIFYVFIEFLVIILL
ncbi:MAG: hypothetical protein U9P71_03775 [Campylobacterota bacterium]|nr:hypothetical protein [Campylobacterota bacterium]